MSAILAASVTLDTEELFIIPNTEAVGVPNISNIVNLISNEDIYGLTNGANTN